MTTPLKRRPNAFSKLIADDAFIALLIAAMDASGYVSAAEIARAHNIIWSMQRFRHRSDDTVWRKIARMRTLVEKHGASPGWRLPHGKFRHGCGRTPSL